MTSKRFEDWLREAIDQADMTPDGTIRCVETFEEAGVLTRDRGLVVTFVDGSEIQVTLVQSQRGRDDDKTAEGDDA